MYLPTELLCSIFALLDTRSLVFATAVCRQWHRAAIGDPRLWTQVVVLASDVHRPEVLEGHLTRSKHIHIGVRITLAGFPDLNALHYLLSGVIKPHLHRCRSLLISASRREWRVIADAFHDAQFVSLKILDLQDDDTLPWQTDEEELEANGPSAVFPLLRRCIIGDVRLRGVSLTNFESSRVQLDRRLAPELIVGPDHCLIPSIFRQPTRLSLNQLRLPTCIIEPWSSPSQANLRWLELRELAAAPLSSAPRIGRSFDLEQDCASFFHALDTSQLTELVLDAFDPSGRVWDDFLDVLSARNRPPKFPRVSTLTIRRMDVGGDWNILFAAFPVLTELRLDTCYGDTVQAM
ncbi:hypothetical protein HMN09_01294200 [Mycena chlorophos]|uniref:F-box domain-containing protein n=1 Tax=Mycena chlorophos TaxID=658473 RepID=A0A8H6S0U7_MYCCL|nr:hypothetical protein HMN09_01294200 [Mycena chlorophos]